MPDRAADDYAEIARRLREIRDAEKPPPPDDGSRADEPATDDDEVQVPASARGTPSRGRKRPATEALEAEGA